MGVHEHKASGKRRVRCAVVTVSDTRTPETDSSGARIRELVHAAGHEVISHRIIPDDPAIIREVVRLLAADSTVEAVLLTGGTGVGPRDQTFETVRPMLDKEIEGFGELFRMLSYQEIGSAAMLSRAIGGTIAGKVLFSMPGSTAAVELAVAKLILPELGHVLHLLKS
ncbi:MAG: MogA/MoaB family molybdenum cofactor biosynthesis protein [Candidatus Binatia bacterium]